MKKASTSKYAKGKPIGLRSSKVRTVQKSRARVAAVPQTTKTLTPRSRPRLSLAERSRRKALRVLATRRLQARLRAAQALKVFFTRALAQSASMLAILVVFGAGFLGQAQSSSRTFNAAPTSCSGWQNADGALAIDVLGNGETSSFNAENSATIASRAGAAPDQPLLKCKGFALPPDFPQDVDIRHIQLGVSLATLGNPDSVDALVIESSLDGEQWSTLESFFLTEDTSNAANGGYRMYDFPALNKDNLGSLQVRVRFASVPSDIGVQAFVDGMSLAVSVRQVVSAEALNLPKNVVQVEKQNVPTNEEPVMKVEIEKQARMKFLGFKDTKRTVDEVQVTTPEGMVQVASFDIQNVTEGSTTYAKLNIHTDKFTRPGKYTAQVTVLQDDKLAIVTSEFTWGVLVINMNRSVYWPGETVQFGMGALDPFGHTVCDAKLALTIVAPDGTKTVQTTEQTEKGVKRSTTCGRDNVTDVADYSAEYDTFDEGNYAVTLTAKTASGEYTITDAIVVDAVIPFAISRRGSMRIYPPVAYTMALDVRPQKDFLGVVEDYVPPSFEILKVSDGGKVIKTKQRTTIRWFVNWKAGTTHTLTYRYDAPDISPELFRLGPVKVGDYQESRQWQIASDATSGYGLLAYDEDGAVDTTPHYRTWSGADLSAEGQLANEETANDDVNHTIVECSSARNECIRGALTDSGHLDVQVWDGNAGTWSNGGSAPTNGDFTTGIGTTNDVYRAFDIAYEDSTGDGMVVYESTSTANGTIMYRTWDGTNWSAEQTITYSGVAGYVAGVAFWVELEADYGSDNILLAFYDGTNNDIYAMRWSGTAWANSGSDLYTLITGAGTINSKQSFDIAWEGTSGKGKIVYGTGTTTGASTYTAGSGWAADTSPFNPAVAVQWVRIAGSPNNNYIASMYNAVVSTTSADMYVDMWNGTDWTSVTTPAGDADINNNGYAQPMDVAWEGGTSDRALFVWRDGTTSETTIRYMVFDIAGHALGSNVFVAPDSGAGATGECTLTSDTDDNVATGGLSAAEDANGPCTAAGMGWENEVSGIDLNSDPGSAKIMLVGEDLTADLKPEAQLWNGTAAGTWLTQTSNMGAFEIDLSQGANLSATLPTKAYDFAFYRYSVVTISGTAYTSQTEGATLNSSGGEIKIVNAANGRTATDADGTDGSGAWTAVLQTPTNGDMLVIYLNGATADGALVLEYGASCTGTPNCTSLKLYQNNVIVRSEHTGNTITNTEIAGCDADSGTNCNDAEIGFTSNLSGTYNLTVSSGFRFLVWTGDTFTPGGTVTTNATGGDFHVDDNAVATLDTASNVIGRDVLVDGGGTININTTTRIDGGDITTSGTSAVVTYSGTPTLTIADVWVCDATADYIGGGTTPTLSFYNLTVGYGGCGTTTISNTATVNQTLSVPTTATLTLAADVSVGVSLTTGSNSVVTYSGTPTLTMTGTGDLGSTAVGAETMSLYNVTTSGTGTITNKLSFSMAGTLTVGTSTTFTYANTPTLTMSGTSKSIAGAGSKTFYDLAVTGSISWTGTGTNNVAHNLSVSSGSLTWSGAGTNIITNIISVATGASFSFSTDITSAGATIAGTGAISTTGTPIYYATGGTIGGSSTGTVSIYKLTASSGITQIGAASGGVVVANLATVSAGARLNVYADLSVGAGLTNTTTGIIHGLGAGTVTFTGTGNFGGGNSGTCTVGGLTLSAGATVTQQSVSCQTNGNMTIPATATYNGGTNDLDMFGGTMSGNGTVTFTGGTVRIRQTGNFGGDTAWTFNNLYFDIATITSDQTTTAIGAGSITVNGQLTTTSVVCCLGEGSYNHILNAGSKTWILTKSGTGALAPFVNGGRLVGSTSTFRYTGTADTQLAITDAATGNAFYNLEIKPNVSTSQTYTPNTSLIVDNNFTAGNVYSGISFPTFTLDFSLTNISPTIGGTFSCFAPIGDVTQWTLSGTGTWTIGTSFDTTYCGWGTDAGNTVLMNGTSATIINAAALYNLNIDPTSAGTVTINSYSFSVTNTLTVASGDTLSISSGLTVSATGASDVAGTGIISGAGTLRFVNTSGGPGTTLTTLSSIVRFDAGTANIASTTVDARTYGGLVEFYSNVAAVRSITLPTGTFTFSGNVSVTTGASQSGVLTVDASNGGASNPTVNITGDLTYTKGGSATPAITTGTGTWTAAGNVTVTNGTFTATAGNTLVMSGTGKTLTSNSQTLQNLTLSGTITLANATHTVAGNLVLGNTVTPGTSTVTMSGTSNTITGGGFTLYNLTIDPSSAGTITLQTSDLTVSNTLNISASDALTINASRTLTHTGATLTLTGTLNGPGTYKYRSSTAFPTGGALAAGLILRLDPTSGAVTMGARTDYQYVEIDNSQDDTASTITSAAGTITLANNLSLMNTGAGASTTIFQLDTNDPTFTVNGDTTIAAGATLTAPSGGALNLKGNYANSGTFTHSSGTVTFNGTGTQTLSGTLGGSSSFSGLAISNTGSVTHSAALTAVGAFSIANGATLAQGANVNITLQGSTVSIASGGTFTKASGSGIFILDGTSQTFTDSNVTKQNLGTVQIGQSPSTVTLSSDMSTENLNIHTTDTLNTKGYDVTVTHHVDCQGTCTLDMTDTAPNNEGDGTVMDVGGNWTMSGTLTAYTNSTVFMNSTAATNAQQTIVTNGQSFYNFECKNAGTTNDDCIISGNLIVAGNLTLTDGALDISTNNPNVNVAKDVSIASAASVMKGTGTWTFDGTTAATYTDSTATPQNIGAVTFNKTSGVGANDKVTLASSMTVDTANIATGDTLDLASSGYTLTLANAGATATVLTVTGTLTPNTNSTVKYTATNSGGNVNVTTTTYHHLEVAGAETYDLSGNLTGSNGLGGNVTIGASATLDAKSGSNYGIDVAGNWANSGTFTARNGAVNFDGADSATQVISGSTSFYDFSASTSGNTAGRTLRFTASTTQTVTGTWTITGFSGKKITLESSSTPTQWTINPTAASVTYVQVSDSNDTGVAICATYSTATGGNNTGGWSVSAGASCGIDVAGTSNSSGGTVKVAVNGSLQAQTTTLAASWTITGVSVNSGDKVTVFVDAAAESAETTGVTKYDGTGNIGGLVLDTNVLTVGSDDNASLVLTDLGLYDNDNSEDVMQTANASVLTVDGGSTYSTEQITVKASNTLTIGTTETLSTHHLNNAGTLVGTGNAAFDVFGNWTNSSTFTHNTSTVTFKATGTGKTINNGASSFYNVTFNGSGGAWSALTNTMTVTNDLIMTAGTFDTATGTANVVVNGNVQCLTTCGTINMTSTNTFTQSVSASKAFGTNVAVGTNWTFNNLTFTASSGTPTITFNGTGTGQIIVGGTLSTTNGGTSLVVDNETNDRIIDANGACTIGSGTTFQASSTAAFNVAGNWTNNGDFTDGTGTVTLDGGSQQTVDGQLTGANDRFNNLIITNASGSNPETSPSVILAASAETAGTFTAATANTKIRFLAGGTYTFQNISFNGGAIGTRVALRSSSTGTTWALNVAGTRSVTKTDVRDSNACGQAPNIDATDGTNYDSTNNNCWDINTLTFAINDVAVGFGKLSSAAATWANAGATGSASAIAAHTLAVTTNARNGYALSYFGPTLVGPETIDAATFTSDADGTQNSKQFAMSITTDGDGTIPSAYQYTSNNYSFVPSTTTTLMSETGPTATETASVYYICNIAQTTLPGSYTTSITYIATGTF